MLIKFIKSLERVAEELMGRRKWKLYQDALIPKRGEAELSSDEESVQTDPPPALKIKTIEQINEDETKEERVEEKVARRPETILESLIKRPATQPKLEVAEEPADWKPQDKCYFCTDGEPGGGENRPTGAMCNRLGSEWFLVSTNLTLLLASPKAGEVIE
ncbi:hypothetical protein SFRURICE_000060 [Spodoptera frugiperda]|nr:hypothetical protein SFRURICE_000060 [Spodoptera frugiperda]